jgi:hypothetical protein
MNYFYNSIVNVRLGINSQVKPFKVFRDECGKKFFLFSDLLMNMGYSEKDIFQTCKYWMPYFIDAGITFVPLKRCILNHGSQVYKFGDHEGLIPIKVLGGLKYSALDRLNRSGGGFYNSQDLMRLAEFCLANYGEADESDMVTEPQMKVESKSTTIVNQVDIGTALMELASSIRELSKAIIIANEEVSEPMSSISSVGFTDSRNTCSTKCSNCNSSHSKKSYSVT